MKKLTTTDVPLDDEKQRTIAYSTGDKNTKVRDFLTRQIIAEFANSSSFSCVAITADEKLIILADAHGNLQTYDVSGGYAPGKFFQMAKKSKLPNYERVKVYDLERNEFEKQRVRQSIHVSRDSSRMVVTYQGLTAWESFLWTTNNLCFVKRVASNQPLKYRYPEFTFDGEMLVMWTEWSVLLHSSRTGCLVKQYRPTESLRFVHLSTSSNRIAVLTLTSIHVIQPDNQSSVAMETPGDDEKGLLLSSELEIEEERDVMSAEMMDSVKMVWSGGLVRVDRNNKVNVMRDAGVSLSSARVRNKTPVVTLVSPWRQCSLACLCVPVIRYSTWKNRE